MTVFGWDTSHFDGTLSVATMARAKAEGISFVTAKVGEGLSYDDVGDATALAAARDAGIGLLGGYFVPRSGNSPAAEVDYMLRLADRDEPWWRTFPGWFWQVDLERWPYDDVSAATGILFAQEVRRRTGRWTILYASNGQYGGGLTGWDGALWNAHYTTGAAAGFAAMYPGDNWQPAFGGTQGGWAAYSGREPTVLQYTSSATIAGRTTCDANAYRGTADQLRALIEGTHDVEITTIIPSAGTPDVPNRTLDQVLGDLWRDTHLTATSQYLKLDAILTLLGTLGTTLGALSVSGIDVVALASSIATQVIAAHDALTMADAPVIQVAVLDALRKGTGPTS